MYKYNDTSDIIVLHNGLCQSLVKSKRRKKCNRHNVYKRVLKKKFDKRSVDPAKCSYLFYYVSNTRFDESR